MIRLFTAGVRTGLVAAMVAAAIPMMTFAQTDAPAIESVPVAPKPAVTNSSPTNDENGTDKNTAIQTSPPATLAIPPTVAVEIQSRFNELRRDLLDNRAAYIDRWLAVVAVVLTFFGIVVAIAGLVGFSRFREIEKEVNKRVENAERLVEEIKSHRDVAKNLVKDISAQTVTDDPEEVKRAVTSIRENPQASRIDKAIASAVSLQQQGKENEAIEMWRAIAHVAEGSDNNQAAKAWFSVGYLSQNPEASILAYDQAIRLKPDLAAAYNNRGIAKNDLKQHKDAIADYDEAICLKADYAAAYNNRGNVKKNLKQYKAAIADYDEALRLKADYAEAYYNRGVAKEELGLKDEARKDFETVLERARNANNEKLTALADQALRDLDPDGGS